MIILQRDSSFVAKIYIAFQSKRNLYLAMRYVDGGDCAALPKPLDEIRTKEYIAGVVLAIEFLHQNNIVHRFVPYTITFAFFGRLIFVVRDLKPDNLLIGSHGQIMLTDFGINLNLKSLYNDHIRGKQPAVNEASEPLFIRFKRKITTVQITLHPKSSVKSI